MLPLPPDPGQSIPECSAGQERSTAEPLVWPGTSGSQRERDISHAARDALGLALAAGAKHPCAPFIGTESIPQAGGVQGQFLLSVRCAAATGTLVQLWEDKTKIQRSPGSPWALPAGGCNKSRARLGSPCRSPRAPHAHACVTSTGFPSPTVSEGKSDPGPRHPPHHRPHSGHDPTWTPATDIPRDQTLHSFSHWGGGLAPVCPSSPLGEPRWPCQVQGGCHEFLNS